LASPSQTSNTPLESSHSLSLYTFLTFILLSLLTFSYGDVVNGGFEQGCTSSYCYGLTGSQLTGWSVSSGDIDLLRSDYWIPHSGSYSLDLDGYSAGTIRQNFCTRTGNYYTVDFYLNGNGPIGETRTVRVWASGNAPADYLFEINGAISGSNWLHATYTFTASSTASTVFFQSLTAGTGGPVLDDVSIIGDTTCGPNCVAECSGFSWTGVLGYFCDSQGVGFCQCLSGDFAPQSAWQRCAEGTSCQCARGVECSTEGSPCA